MAAVIRDGYQLYTGNFRRLFKASWIMAIVYALAFALMTSRLIYDVLPMAVSLSAYPLEQIDWWEVTKANWLAIASVLLFLITVLLLASYALTACREHKQTATIAPSAHWWGTWPRPKALMLLLKGLRWLFPRGLRHFGLLFATLIVTAIITLLLTFFCELPGFIIGIANVKAYTGVAMGDNLGMPDYLPTLTFIAFTITGFIQGYMHLSTIFPFYYAYGSIEAQEQERKKMKL